MRDREWKSQRERGREWRDRMKTIEEPKKIDTKDLKHTQQGRRSRTQAG